MFDWLNQEVLYAYSVPFFVLVIVGEVVYSYIHQKKLYQVRDTLTSAFFALLNIGLDLLMKGFSFLMLGWAYAHRIVEVEHFWAYVVLLVLLQDFAYYVHHYMDHRCRLFWAVHSTHHNSDLFNITTGFRSPVFQPLYRYCYFMPVAWLGFEPLHIMFAYSASQIYGTLIHTQAIHKMGWLEYILVTPSHHRVHHASNTPYLDKNMGMLFIFWDKIFGTFAAEGVDSKPVHFGLVSPLTQSEKDNPLKSLMHEFKGIWQDVKQGGIGGLDRVKYILGRPGWSHDGSRQTSVEMQTAWWLEQNNSENDVMRH